MRQPDGTLIHCYATGDEFHNWLHDKDNFTIMQDPLTGSYVYAIAKAGQLRPTRYLPGSDDPAAVGLIPGANITVDQYARQRAAFLSGLPAHTVTTATTGTMNNIVVFIRFSGEGEFTDSVTSYTRLYNSPASGYNSMYGYFMEASYNRLSVLSTFYPTPVGGVIVSYQDDHVRNYYRVYNAVSNPIGYKDGERGYREAMLLTDALEVIGSQVPAELNIDADNNGFVDNISFIVSGSAEGWSSLLWPHMSGLPSSAPLINGKHPHCYNLLLRDHQGNGTSCHEMLHSLGAPDLYHYSGHLAPVDEWDIMGSTNDPPQHPTMYIKCKYLKWISSIPDITTSGQYSLSPTTSATSNAYRIESPYSTKECFVLEYRRKTGEFERRVPGDGLIVYRINTAASGNAGGPPDEVYVYRPNGTATSDGSVRQAAFSSEAGRTMISDSTNPPCFLSDNSEGGLYVYDIGNAGNTITFKYRHPGIVSITGDNLVLGQTGTVTAVILSPQTAEYWIEIRDSTTTGPPLWTWTTIPSSVQVTAGTHYAFTFTVRPTSAVETFWFSLRKRNLDGSLEVFGAQPVTLSATSGGKGTITITAANAEGWPGPYDKATVRLLDSTGTEIGSAKTNIASTVNFSNVPSGHNYGYMVFFQGSVPFGEQYWGSRGGLTVVANATTNEAFIRNAPYAPEISVYDNATGSTINSRDTIAPGTSVRIEVIVKNPSYPGSLETSSRARLLIDRDLIPPYDLEQTSPYLSYGTGENKKIVFTFTPTTEGAYAFAGEVLSDIGGFELTTDAGIWGTLFTVRGAGPGTGDLSITVSDAEDWGDAGNCASIRLLNSGGNQVGMQSTDATSNTIFSGILADTGYSYRVYYLSSSRISPFGEQYWGMKTGIAIVRGATTHEGFTRNLPYALTISVYDSLTGAEVTYDTVHLASSLRIELQLKNPGFAGALAETCRVRLILDRDQIAPYDFDQTTGLVSLAINEIKSVSLYVTSPWVGPIFAAAAVTTLLPGTPTITDAGVWKSRPVIIVQGADTSAPPPPVNLAATPSSWSSVDSFSVDWVNPIDPSAIAAAWFKWAYPPESGTDGTRTTAKPIVAAATAEGGQSLYLWLEDGTGNRDHRHRSETQVFWDGTPPSSGTISINSGTPSCATMVVQLTGLAAHDAGGSGLSGMRFSNNDSSWTPWETIAASRVSWNLSEFGGNSAEGVKRVYVQYRDIAGNTSSSFSDDIFYSTSSVQLLDESIATTFALMQNYPNPFNPSTSIPFQVPCLVHTTLQVHNLLGEIVATLVDESVPKGRYKVIWDSSHWPSGVYFVRMTAEEYVEIRRVMLVK